MSATYVIYVIQNDNKRCEGMSKCQCENVCGFSWNKNPETVLRLFLRRKTVCRDMVCGELRRERRPFALRNTAFCLPEITCLWAKTWCFTAVLLCFCRKNKPYCLHRLRVVVRNNHDASRLRLHALESPIGVRMHEKSERGRCGASRKIKKIA